MYELMLFTANKLQKSEKGASAVEYGILIAGIAVLVMGAVFALGPAISGMFDKVTEQVKGTN